MDNPQFKARCSLKNASSLKHADPCLVDEAFRFQFTRAVLQNSAKLKCELHNEVNELIRVLREREHKLCLEIDEKSLEQCQDIEKSVAMLHEDGCHLENERYFQSSSEDKGNDQENSLNEYVFFNTKLNFESDFDYLKLLVQEYGWVVTVDCAEEKFQKDDEILPNTERLSQSFKYKMNGLIKKLNFRKRKGTVESKVEDGSIDFIDSFEVIDPAENEELNGCSMNDDIEVLSTDKIPFLQLSSTSSIFSTQVKALPYFPLKEKFEKELPNDPEASPKIQNLPTKQVSCEPSALGIKTFDCFTFFDAVPNELISEKKQVSCSTQEKSQKNTEKENIPEVKATAKTLLSTNQTVKPLCVFNELKEGSSVPEDKHTPSDIVKVSFNAYLSKDDPKAWLCEKEISSHWVHSLSQLNEWCAPAPLTDKSVCKNTCEDWLYSKQDSKDGFGTDKMLEHVLSGSYSRC